MFVCRKPLCFGIYMAIASGPASPVLARPIFDVPAFKTALAQPTNKQIKIIDHQCTAVQYKTC